MVDVLQFAKDFGLPLGLLVAAVIVLWRERKQDKAKIEELYERWARSKRGEDDPETMAKIEQFLEEANAALAEMRAARAPEEKT